MPKVAIVVSFADRESMMRFIEEMIPQMSEFAGIEWFYVTNEVRVSSDDR